MEGEHTERPWVYSLTLLALGIWLGNSIFRRAIGCRDRRMRLPYHPDRVDI